MNFSWAGMQKSIREFWTKLSRPQKIVTVVAPLLVALALIALIIWASTPQYVPIFTQMSAADAGAITAKLTDLKIPYQLADGGATIMVPEQQEAQTRLELANAGLPQGSVFSFANLNQIHLGETDADQQLRYVLGLQDELETTLKTLNGVQDARVQIVMPQPSLFADPQNTDAATAAVTLKLAPGVKLSDDQVRGVANLLAYSVQGLKPDKISIVDTNGDVLSNVLGNSNDPNQMSGTQLQLQQTVDDGIQKSVQSMLDRAFGPGNTIVRVNATLDFNQTKIVQDTHGPGAIVSEQSTSENTTNGSTAGTPTTGVTSNVGTYQTTTQGTNSTTTKTTTTRNYQVDNTQTEQVVSPGAIKRLSVSVLANSDNITQAQLSQIQGVVASASGIDQTRGDQIQVAAIPFNNTTLQQEKAAMAAAEQRQQIVTYVEIGLGVLAGIVLLLLYLRRNAKRKREARGLDFPDDQPMNFKDAEEVLLAQQRAEQEAQANLAKKRTKSVEEIEHQKVKEAVELYSRNNPDEAARLIKTWLAEDK